MEPTICKPEIYNGAGIYNTGAGGGGFNDCVEIAGKYYKTKKINNKIWITENFCYVDNNINLSTSSSSSPQVAPCLNFFNLAAVVYLTQNENNLLNGFRVARDYDYNELINNFGALDLLSLDFGGNNSSGISFDCTGVFHNNLYNEYNNYSEMWIGGNSYDMQNNAFFIARVEQTTTITTIVTKEAYRPIRLCKDA